MDYSVMDIEELCKLLIISKKSAYHLLNSGKIKGFKIGSKWKIPRENFNAFIKHQLYSDDHLSS